MKALLKSTKKIFFVLALVLSFVFIDSGVLISQLHSALAFENGLDKTPISSIENNDFTSHDYSHREGKPYGLSDNWTLQGDLNVNSGVVVIDKYESFGLDFNPQKHSDATDSSILCFNSLTPGQASATSKEKKLEKGKFYEIVFYVKTANGGVGSATAKFGDEVLSFSSIHTSSKPDSAWQKRSFVIATDSIKEQNFTLTLNYGALNEKTTGAVFYDHIIMYELTPSYFYNYVADDTTSQKVNFNRRNATELTENFFNSKFDEPLDNNYWTKSSLNTGSEIMIGNTSSIEKKIKDNFKNEDVSVKTNTANNVSSLLILNKIDGKTTLTTTDKNYILIPQHGFYKMTILYKTGNVASDSGFNVKLVPQNTTHTEKEQTKLSSSTKMAAYNDYSLATFYIKGSTKQDEKVGLSLGFGEKSGWVVIDEINFYPITSSEYKSNASSTYELDLTTDAPKTSNLTNGHFEFVENSSYDISYPMKPSNWSEVKNNSNTESGVIRINPEYFIKDNQNGKYGSAKNPGLNKVLYPTIEDPKGHNFYQNVLMISNDSNDEVIYSSEERKISANETTPKTAGFSVDIKTQDNAKAFIQVVDEKGKILARIDDINTNNKWEEKSICIKNGSSELTVKFQIGVKGGREKQYVFFDFAEYYSDLTDLTKLKSTPVMVDYINNSFASHETNGLSGFYGTYDFSLFERELSPLYGVIDAQIYEVPLRDGAKDDYLLKLNNDQKCYQTIISNYSYQLKKDGFYEMSVWVKTDGTDGGALFEIMPLDKDGNIASNRDTNTNKFEAIKTNDVNNNNWVQYTILLSSTNEQKVKVMLGLGSNENPVKGNVYFDDLRISPITKEDYVKLSNERKGATTLVTKTIELPKEEDKKEETTTPSEKQPIGMNIWALASSILLVIALALAIAGYLIRRLPKKVASKKVDKSDYEKPRDDVDVNSIKEEISLKLAKDKSELTLRVETLKKELESVKAEYDEKALAQEDKTDNKLYTEYTKKTNSIISEMNYLSSALKYLDEQSNITAMEKRIINEKRAEAQREFEKMNYIAEEQAKEEKKEKANEIKKAKQVSKAKTKSSDKTK